MKKNILKVIFLLLFVAIIGFYVFDIVVNHTPFTKNLFRAISTGIICLLGYGRLNYSVGRRSLEFYESQYADLLKNAFSQEFMNRKKLLCAARLFDEHNYRKALKYLGQLRDQCKTADDYYAVWHLVALCFTRSGMYPEAIRMYRQMIENDLGDSRVHSNMGYNYSELGELDKAMSCYNEALYLDAKNANTHVNIANIHFEQHNLDEATEWAEKAYALDSKLAAASSLLAIIYAITDRKDLAEKYRHIAIANGEDPEDLKNAIQRYMPDAELLNS